MTRLRLGCFLATLLLGSPAAAEPRNTVWLQDAHVEPRGGTETAFSYDFQAPDTGALAEGIDVLSLWLTAGVAERLEVLPTLSLRQRGEEPLRLHEVGLQARGRVLGEPEAPHLMVYGAYSNDLGDERDHHLLAGATGRYDVKGFFASGDARGSALFGGQLDPTGEFWLGVGVGYGFLAERQLTVGLETFVIVPIAGPRISDPTFGLSAESVSYYYGPTFSWHADAIWTAVSAVTGFPVSDAASHLLLRWMVGLRH